MLGWTNRNYETIITGVLGENNNMGNAMIDIPFKRRLDEDLEKIHEG